MKQLTPEQIGTDYAALLELIGEERALELIGAERVLKLIGEERLLDDLLRRKGEAWLRERLEQRTRQAHQTGPDAGPKP